jgi:hypothetical protein
VAPGVWQQGMSSWRGVHAGTCYAWPLPADGTCATIARQAFRDAVSGVGLEDDLLEDCVLMASELAANTLHAQAVAEAGGGGNRLASVKADVEGESITSAGPAPQTRPASRTREAAQAHRSPLRARKTSRIPQSHRPSRVPRYPQAPAPARAPQAELWLYLRGVGTGRELVCKVFDCYRGWRDGAPPAMSGPAALEMPDETVSGRGLQIVHELSGGRWGHHPTRARLDGWGLRGKAVWFAVPAPLAHARLVDVTGLRAYTFSADVTAARATDRLSARQAARELETMLDERGFGSGLVRDDQPGRDLSILSVRRGLTVWCQAGVVSLTTPWGSSQQWNYADLVEAAEQTVRRFEELDLEQDLVSTRLSRPAPAGLVSVP